MIESKDGSQTRVFYTPFETIGKPRRDPFDRRPGLVAGDAGLYRRSGAIPPGRNRCVRPCDERRFKWPGTVR